VTLGQEQFLSAVGMSHEMLGVCMDEAWLMPTSGAGERGFSGIDVARALLICDLHTNLGVNYEGIGVVLNLVDQLYGLRSAMAELVEAARVLPRRL
jgi:chaperone modulatory protein CbpM